LGEVDVDDGASEAAVLVVAEAGDACLVRRELDRRADAMTSDDVVAARLEPDAIAAGDSIIDRRQPVAWIEASPRAIRGRARGVGNECGELPCRTRVPVIGDALLLGELTA